MILQNRAKSTRGPYRRPKLPAASQPREAQSRSPTKKGFRKLGFIRNKANVISANFQKKYQFQQEAEREAYEMIEGTTVGMRLLRISSIPSKRVVIPSSFDETGKGIFLELIVSNLFLLFRNRQSSSHRSP